MGHCAAFSSVLYRSFFYLFIYLFFSVFSERVWGARARRQPTHLSRRDVIDVKISRELLFKQSRIALVVITVMKIPLHTI